MHYIAWVIAQGGVPYRDVFDMNLPGVYLIHAAVIAVLGRGDLAWRVFDLGWLAATAALLWAYGRPAGRASAAAAALLFTLYHLSGGVWRAGQRDFLMCPFLLAGALGVARSIEGGGATRPLLWGALALGAGMTLKPHAGLFWLAAAGLAAWGARRAGRSAPRALATVLTAGLAIPALVFGWLAWRGGLAPFIAMYTGYVIPLYSRVGRVSLRTALGWYQFGVPLWPLLGALALFGLARPAPGAEVRRTVAAVGALCGALHFFLQGKYWEYQLYPLALFLCALSAFAVRGQGLGAPSRRAAATAPGPLAGLLPGRAALAGLARPALLAHLITAAVFAALVVVLGAKAVDAI